MTRRIKRKCSPRVMCCFWRQSKDSQSKKCFFSFPLPSYFVMGNEQLEALFWNTTIFLSLFSRYLVTGRERLDNTYVVFFLRFRVKHVLQLFKLSWYRHHHIHLEFVLVTCYPRIEYKICNFEAQLNTFLSQLQTECKSISTYILHERELSSKRSILNNAAKSMALAYSKTVAWGERRGVKGERRGEKGEGRARAGMQLG